MRPVLGAVEFKVTRYSAPLVRTRGARTETKHYRPRRNPPDRQVNVPAGGHQYNSPTHAPASQTERDDARQHLADVSPASRTECAYDARRFLCLSPTGRLLLVLLGHTHPTRVAVLGLGAREARRDLREGAGGEGEGGEREVSGRDARGRDVWKARGRREGGEWETWERLLGGVRNGVRGRCGRD